MADPHLKPIKCRQTLGEYAARVTWCEACGRPESEGKCDLHHVIKRGRSDERCNLLKLCAVRWCNRCYGSGRMITASVYGHSPEYGMCDVCSGHGSILGCHERAEAHGTKYWLPLGVILSIKKLRDPAGWNPERLAQLRLKNLPDLLPIPETLLAEFNRWQHVHSQTEGEVPW